MKKLLKILILVLGLIPILINAEEKEVKYKWYKEIEENIHYESDAENVCEYFDKNNFITTNWNYTSTKPKEENYRIIEEVEMGVEISRYYSKYFELKYFPLYGVKIYEMEFYDNSNNKIEYNIRQSIINNQDTNILNDGKQDNFINLLTPDELSIELKEVTNIMNMKINIYHEENSDFQSMYVFSYVFEGLLNNAFSAYEEEVKTECNGNYCLTEITFKEENCMTEPLKINTVGYRYKDYLYKCYDKQIEYAPGYHLDLTNENYIKDENDFIIIEEDENTCPTIEIPELTCPSNTCPTTEIPNVTCPSCTCPTSSDSITNLNSTQIESNNTSTPEEIIDEPITEEITNKIETQIEKLKTPIAMVTKEEAKEQKQGYLIYITIFTIASLLLSVVIIAKKSKYVE